MEIAALVFLRSVIRYFVPGLAFYALVVCVPVLLVFGEPSVTNLQLFDAPQAISFGIVLGYTLDAVGAYRWTAHYRQYRATREDIPARLKESPASSGRASDPDKYLAELWLQKPMLYDRVMQERAEWVVVLEIAATLMVAAIVMVGCVAVRWTQGSPIDPAMVLWAIAEAVASFAASAKGVQRIWPYNDKVVIAVQSARSAPHERQDVQFRRDRGQGGLRGWVDRLTSR
jgi:hypothetical protein